MGDEPAVSTSDEPPIISPSRDETLQLATTANTTQNYKKARGQKPRKTNRTLPLHCLYCGRVNCYVVAIVLTLVGALRMTLSITAFSLTQQNSKLKQWMRCYLIIMEPLLAFCGASSTSAFALATAESWFVEIAPGIALLIGCGRLRTWYYDGYAPLMTISVCFGILQAISAVIFSFFHPFGHAGIYSAIFVTGFRLYCFWCGYMLKRGIDKGDYAYHTGGSGRPLDIQCQLMSIQTITSKS